MHLKKGFRNSFTFLSFLNSSLNSNKHSVKILIDWKEGVVIFQKTETKISKIQHYKDKILNRNTIKKKHLAIGH